MEDWLPLIYIGCSGLLILIIGIILILLWHTLKVKQQIRIKYFLSRDLIHKIKRVMLEGIEEAMDKMPAKMA